MGVCAGCFPASPAQCFLVLLQGAYRGYAESVGSLPGDRSFSASAQPTACEKRPHPPAGLGTGLCHCMSPCGIGMDIAWASRLASSERLGKLLQRLACSHSKQLHFSEHHLVCGSVTDMLYMSWVSAGVSVLLGVSLGWFLEQHSELLSRMWLAGARLTCRLS